MSPSKTNLGGTDIYYIDIADGGGSRRDAECASVNTLLSAAGLGVLGHHESGAPFLVDHPNLKISVSHSRRLAAIAVGRGVFGIDAEEMRPNLQRVLPRVLSADELRTWADHPLHAWTAKEALYKAALTCGLDFRKDICLGHYNPTSPTQIAHIGTATYTLHYHQYGSTLICVAMAND